MQKVVVVKPPERKFMATIARNVPGAKMEIKDL